MDSERIEIQKVVDLGKWLKESNNRLLRNLPGCLVNRLKKMICEKEMNALHNDNIDKMGIDYVNAILKDLDITIRMHNEKALEKADKCIFVANHPLGGIDALSFLHCIYQLKGKVVSPSNQFFNYDPNLAPLIVGVNVFGSSSREQTRVINHTFQSDAQIMIFPAGLVSRKINGEIKDLEWHKSFVSKAIETKRYVVPTFITGVNTPKFYRISRFRKFFRIKMPVEILCLPREMLNKKGSSIDLIFGNPIAYNYFDASKRPHEWAQHVKNMVYDLGKNFEASHS
jgi:1-acyl-sn-glycerol-3-phosphate acyltransferase